MTVILIVAVAAVIVTAVISHSVFSVRNKKISEAVAEALEKYSSLKNDFEESKKSEAKKDGEISSLNENISNLSEKLSDAKASAEEKTKALEAAQTELEKAKEDIRNQDDKIRFIADIINAPPVELPAMQEYKKLLAIDYREYAKNNDALSDEAGALLKLQEVEQQLELFSYDEAIAQKSVVAIAGSFSSGKSSFMNSLFADKKVRLPTGMTQTTAISSYVLPAESASIIGHSFRGGRVAIPEKIFGLFSHEKMQEFNFNMKQLVHNIIFRNKFVHDFKNLCFIDTPGFNPGTEQESDTDAATTAISTASALIWCVDTCAGTIKDDEIDILYDIYRKNENISIYVVANKADLRSIDEVESVLDEIESQLQGAEIPFVGISAYSSGRAYSSQDEEFKSRVRGIPLNDFLTEKDVENNQKENFLLSQVKEVFDAYIQADKARIEKLEKQIRTFSTLQSSFMQQIDKKDDVILQYKAQRDRKYKGKIDEEVEDNDELFDDLIEIRADLQNTIKKDKNDIEQAEELCRKMNKCISDLFGHTLKEPENGETASRISTETESEISDEKKAAVQKLAEVIAKSKDSKTVASAKKENEFAAKRIIVWATDSNASTDRKSRWQFEREKPNGSIVKTGEKIATIKVFNGRSTVNYNEACPIYAQSDGKVFYLKDNSPKIDDKAVAIICDKDDTESAVYAWAKENGSFLGEINA